MPLKGTKREQKHYRRIRKEYPEKGKEYAARVARNIVRANTPSGRKLKGTTQYGRDWGPPYSEPLSKKGELMNFYKLGQDAALEKLGYKPLLSALSRGGQAAKGIAQETGSGLRDIWQRIGGTEGLRLYGGGGREGIAKMWQNLAPEQQALLKQLGIGAGIGGIGGGIAGGQAGGTGGAIAGALGGAGVGALAGRAGLNPLRMAKIKSIQEAAGRGIINPGELSTAVRGAF